MLAACSLRAGSTASSHLLCGKPGHQPNVSYSLGCAQLFVVRLAELCGSVPDSLEELHFDSRCLASCHHCFRPPYSARDQITLNPHQLGDMEGAQQQSFAIVVKKRVFNRQSSTVQRLVQINRDEAMDLCGR
jgi:hypothetical protein